VQRLVYNSAGVHLQREGNWCQHFFIGPGAGAKMKRHQFFPESEDSAQSKVHGPDGRAGHPTARVWRGRREKDPADAECQPADFRAIPRCRCEDRSIVGTRSQAALTDRLSLHGRARLLAGSPARSSSPDDHEQGERYAQWLMSVETGMKQDEKRGAGPNETGRGLPWKRCATCFPSGRHLLLPHLEADFLLNNLRAGVEHRGFLALRPLFISETRRQ
jgi:hypothetical protein